MTDKDFEALEKEIDEKVNEAAEFAKTSAEPSLDELYKDIYVE